MNAAIESIITEHRFWRLMQTYLPAWKDCKTCHGSGLIVTTHGKETDCPCRFPWCPWAREVK